MATAMYLLSGKDIDGCGFEYELDSNSREEAEAEARMILKGQEVTEGNLTEITDDAEEAWTVAGAILPAD